MVDLKINPLNVLDIRELDFPPTLFEYLVLDTNLKKIDVLRDWIYENLKYRFYIGTTLCIENNQIVTKIRLGFEDPKESSFFILSCPFLNDH